MALKVTLFGHHFVSSPYIYLFMGYIIIYCYFEFAGIRKVSDESLGRDETPRHTSHEI